MGNDKFLKKLKATVVKCVNERHRKSDGKKFTKGDIYIVWTPNPLQNNKALASLSDGVHYELTCISDKILVFFDISNE